MLRQSWCCAALLVLAGVAGCAQTGAGGTASGIEPGSAPSSEGVTRSAPAWTEPARYGFVLDATCGERALIGRFRATVIGGRVVRTEGLDDAAKRAVQLRLADLVPTLGELVAEAETARQDGAAVARIDFDPVDGHPRTITVDRAKDVVDDEACYEISEYTTEVTPTAVGSPPK